MSTQYLFANLQNRADGRPSIDFGGLSACDSDPAKLPHRIIGLFLADSSSSTLIVLEGADARAYEKAPSRNKRAAGILGHFLNREQAPMHSSVYLQGRARLRLCDEAILVGAPPGTATRIREGIASYQKVEFYFPGTRQQKSTQMLHVSCPSLQPGATLLDSCNGSIHDSITILSDMCLFTRKILHSTATKGRSDGQKLRRMQPTLYEMECIARLSSIIADVTTLTHSTFGEDSLNSDTCSLEEAIDWIEAVKLRHQQLANVLEKAVWHELCQLWVNDKPPLKAIQISPESARSRSSLLCISSSPSGITHQDSPSGKASSYEQPNRRHGKKQYLARRPLIISLDDRAERKIYSQAHSLLLRLSRTSDQLVHPALIQLYMPRRVYIDGNKHGQRLYWHDPSPLLPLLEGSKEQESRDTPNHDSHRRELHQTDILAELYGRECSANIQGWFKEVDLC